MTGTTERVSVDSAGNQGNGLSDGPAISADGRFVAFLSEAGDLVPGDTNATSDVFVHDRATGATERASVDSAGNQGNNVNLPPRISADGRFVAFPSQATNLVSADTNGALDIFVHNRVSGSTTRVSVDSAGNQGNAQSHAPEISADGRFVAFTSEASDLVPSDTNGRSDAFIHDLVTGTTERVSVDSTGSQGNSDSGAAAISPDGRLVVLASAASNLVAGDTNGTSDVFVHDREAEEPTDLPDLPPQADPPTAGEGEGDIDSDKDVTIVITHGWQPLGSEPDWMLDTKDAIEQDFPEANVITWRWRDADTLLPGPLSAILGIPTCHAARSGAG